MSGTTKISHHHSAVLSLLSQCPRKGVQLPLLFEMSKLTDFQEAKPEIEAEPFLIIEEDFPITVSPFRRGQAPYEGFSGLWKWPAKHHCCALSSSYQTAYYVQILSNWQVPDAPRRLKPLQCPEKEMLCPNRSPSRQVKLSSLYGEKCPVALRPRDLAADGPWEVCGQPHPVSEPRSCAGEFPNLLSPICPLQSLSWRGWLEMLLQRAREIQGQ